MLIVLGGLPGVGKTAIARELACRIGAMHVRVDSIEQAIRASGFADKPLDDTGYRIAYAIAEDNLRIGRTVIADSVNPLPLTRDFWVEVAKRAGVAWIEIEIVCSDPVAHRRRVETRIPDIAGLRLPGWEDVKAREYHPWHREHVVIETSERTVEENVAIIQELLRHR